MLLNISALKWKVVGVSPYANDFLVVRVLTEPMASGNEVHGAFLSLTNNVASPCMKF